MSQGETPTLRSTLLNAYIADKGYNIDPPSAPLPYPDTAICWHALGLDAPPTP
ncbi:MAG: hypothetical protein K2M16_01330 [Muribaculaceae bacterium]|nr:hypothetical protein [Muribaculaceae bacterium]